MTRENKLALVVGFGLILFIGILISDHFSIARSQASANLTDQQIADPLVARTRDEPGLIALKPAPPETVPPSLQPGEPAVNATEMAANGLTGAPPTELMSPEQRTAIDPNAALASAPPPSTSRQQAQAERIPSAPATPPQHVQPVDTLTPESGHAEITTIVTQRADMPGIEGFEPVNTADEINLADMRFHDVRGGESLFAICRQYYGDADMVHALAKFNKMDDPAQVRAGRRLMIPPPQTLGGKSRSNPSPKASPPQRKTPDTATAVALRPVPTDQTKSSKAKTYTVKEGDSLSGIAKRFLGDQDRWRDLHKLNRKVIGDPDNIKAGTVLKLL